MPAKAMIGGLVRPKALLWFGALAISGSIVANALFLQNARHPAPFFAANQSPAASNAKPDETVRALQDALRRAGYYGGPVDGLAGPQTTAAVVAFERITGRDVTGKASPQILEAIRAEGATPSAATLSGRTQAAPVTPQVVSTAPPVPDARVAIVQNALSRAAYGQIRADGVFGPQTSDAIKQFQADHNLPVTGEIDDALIMELATAGALEGE